MSTDGGLVGTLIIRDLVRSTFLFINPAVYGIFIAAKGDQNSLHIPFRVFLNQSPFLFFVTNAEFIVVLHFAGG